MLTRQIDTARPAVTLASASNDPTNGAFAVTAVFTKSVTGLALGDFAVTNGAASGLTGSGSSYSVTITPSGDSALEDSFQEGAATDAAGNTSAASNALTRQIDTARPAVTLASTSGDPTNGAFTVTAVFTKPVTGLVLGDFAVTNGTASGLTGSGSSYSVTITPTGDGAVSVSLPDGAATDAAGNTSTASNALTRQIDTARPAVTLASASGDPTNGAFTVTAVFTKPVTGLVLGDFAVTNGTASGLTGSGASYSVTITPTGDGTVSVSLPDGAAQDAAGNASTASNALTRQIDTARPAVTLASTSGDPTNGAFTVTAVFTKPVTDLALGDFVVTNGTASGLTGSGASYSVTITPTGDGAVSVLLPDGAAQDAAGNTSMASNTLARQIDTARPAVTLASASNDPTNGAFTVTAVFTKPVTGLVLGDFVVTNGTASNFAGSGGSYSVTITPSGDGAVEVSLPEGAAQDAAGNTTLASNALTRQIDTARPSVTLASTSSDPANGPFNVTAVFTKPVTGLAVGDFAVTNGSASGLTGSGASYSVTITPSGDGAVEVSLPEGAASDAAGNTSTASNTLTRQVDTAQPVLTIATVADEPVTGAFTVSFSFSKPVTGFAAGDITVSNGALSDFAGSGAQYSATITPTADGAIILSVPAGAGVDAAGNGSLAASLNMQAKISAPGVSAIAVSLSQIGVGDSGSAFTVTVTFSEAMNEAHPPVIAFTGADVSGTLSFQSGAFSAGGAVYAAQYGVADSGLSASAVGVTVSGARDAFGNQMAEASASGLFSVDMRRAALTLAVAVEGLTDGVFSFDGDLGAFTIATSSQSGALEFNDAVEGVYRISMTAPDGFAAGGVACTSGAGMALSDDQLELRLAPGGAAACTFTAIAEPEVSEVDIQPVTLDLSIDGAGDLPGVSAVLPLQNLGGAPLAFTAQTDAAWLQVTPASGTIPSAGSIELTLSLTDAVLALTPGSHTANVIIETGAGAGPASSARASAASIQSIAVPVTVMVEPREGAITLIATTAPMQAGDGVFTYASTLAAFNGLALETVNGAASSSSVTALEGVYQIVQSAPVGWRVSDISCAGGSATANAQTGELTITLAAEQTMVCTFANVRDEDYVREVTSGAIRAFMAARGDRILSTSPGLIGRLRSPGQGQRNQMRFDMTQGRMTGAVNVSLAGMRDGPQRGAGMQARSSTPFAGAYPARSDEMNPGYSRGGPVEGFGVEHYVWTDADIHNEAFRDWRAMHRAERHDDTRAFLSQSGREALRDGDAGFDVWMSAAWSSARDDRAGQRTRSSFSNIHIGADRRLSDDLLVGVMVQVDRMDTRAGELDSRVEGTGWMAGPYAAARLGSNLYWSGRAAYGRSDNDINPLGLYTDAFTTSRWLFETALAGDIVMGSWRLTPEAALAWFEETQDGYADTLGIDIPSQSISIGRLRAGPEIAYRSETAAGGYVEPFARLMMTWDYDAASVFNSAGVLESLDDVRIDAALGVQARFSNGASLELRGNVDGLGAGRFRASTAQVRLRVPF
ncbi:MAG: Ig-like domain-containing protein [Oceanicaulis sp.]